MIKLNLGKSVKSNGKRKGNGVLNITVCCSTDIPDEFLDEFSYLDKRGSYVNNVLSSISRLSELNDITLNDAVSLTAETTCEIEFRKTNINILGSSAIWNYHLPNVALILMLLHKEIFTDSKISVRAKSYNKYKGYSYRTGGLEPFPYIDAMKKFVKKWVKNNPSDVEALKNVLCEINIGTHDFIPIIQ